MFGFPYSTHLPMPRIYYCFIHFILFLLYRSLNEVEGGIFVSPCPLWTESCPLCIFHNTSHIHFTFTHLINQLPKVCRVLSVVKNSKIWIFCQFQFAPLALSCVHVMWMFKVDSSSKLQFCIFVIFFFNCTFSLSLCGGIKDKFDNFLLQSLWMAGTLE